MEVDKSTKIILLPKDTEDQYTVVHLPLSKELQKSKPFFINSDGSEILELNEITGENKYTKKEGAPILKNGDSVRSFIFELAIPSKDTLSNGDSSNGSLSTGSSNGNTSLDNHRVSSGGFVLESSHMITTTKFNLTYLLQSILHTNQDLFTKRYITLEDVCDLIESLCTEKDWVHKISPSTYQRSLATICQVIDENDEFFYKYSPEKSVEFISTKINKLVTFLKENREKVSLYNHLYSKLLDPTESIVVTDDIIDEMVLRYGIDFVCDSYCLEVIKMELMNKQDFTKLEAHIEGIATKQKNLLVVEENITSVVKTTAAAKNNKKIEKKGKKKEVKKIAVGKGALDGFFKKAK